MAHTAAAAGEGRGPAHQGLRLEGAAARRQPPGHDPRPARPGSASRAADSRWRRDRPRGRGAAGLAAGRQAPPPSAASAAARCGRPGDATPPCSAARRGDRCSPPCPRRRRPRCARGHLAGPRRAAEARPGRVSCSASASPWRPPSAPCGCTTARRARRSRERRAPRWARRCDRRGACATACGDGTYTATYRVISADSHPVTGGFVFTRRARRDARREPGSAHRRRRSRPRDGGGLRRRSRALVPRARARGRRRRVRAGGLEAGARATGGPEETSRGRAKPSSADRAGCSLGARRWARPCRPSGSSSRERSPPAPRSGAPSTPGWSRTCSTPASARSGASGCSPGRSWRCGAAAPRLLVRRAPRHRAPSRRDGGTASWLLRLPLPHPGTRRARRDARPVLGAGARRTSSTSLAMSVWVGGVALLLLALPARHPRARAGGPDAPAAGSVSRFSTVALLAVAVLVASGTVQAILDLQAFGRSHLHRLRPRDPRQDRHFCSR